MKIENLKNTNRTLLCKGVLQCFLCCCLLLSAVLLTFENVASSGSVFASRQSGSGAIVIEQSTARVLYAENADAQLFPASTTKILTALVVLDSVDIHQTVTVPSAAVGVEGSSIYLEQGEKITVEELLFGMMLNSGNDAAAALALSVAKDINSFADLMNRKAKECGATNSHFCNPHGLQDDNHYTTARDLALITARAYQNADFRRIVSTHGKSVAVSTSDGAKTHYFHNKNRFLNMYEGANGVKTGFTKTSGRCLVTGANRDGMQLIAVTLNCSSDWAKHAEMLDAAFQTYHMSDLLVQSVGDKSVLSEGAKRIEVECGFDVDGNLCPSAYPLRRDGTETVEVVLTSN